MLSSRLLHPVPEYDMDWWVMFVNNMKKVVEYSSVPHVLLLLCLARIHVVYFTFPVVRLTSFFITEVPSFHYFVSHNSFSCTSRSLPNGSSMGFNRCRSWVVNCSFNQSQTNHPLSIIVHYEGIKSSRGAIDYAFWHDNLLWISDLLCNFDFQ